MDLGLVALIQLGDEPVRADGLGGLGDVLVSGIQPTVADVVSDRALEQERLLEHGPNLAMQAGLGYVAHVVPIDADRSFIYVVEAAQDLAHRALTCAGLADKGDHLARLCLEGDVLEYHGVRVVTKGHVLELDVSLYRGKLDRIGAIDQAGLCVQQVKDALARGHRRLQLVVAPSQVADRPEKVADVEGKGDQRARGQLGSQHLRATEPDHQANRQRAQQVDRGKKDRRQASSVQVGLEVVLVQLLRKAPVVVRLAREGLYDAHAGDVLLEVGVDQRIGAPCLPVGIACPAAPQFGGDDHDRKHRERD